MWNRFKSWLLEKEYRRVEDFLRREENRMKDEWCARREQLEYEYAAIKRHNEHLTSLLMDRARLGLDGPITIKQDLVN